MTDEDMVVFGDCTNSSTREANWTSYYCCNQDGIHYHCTKHPEIELECVSNKFSQVVYRCPRCGEDIGIENPRELKSRCLRLWKEFYDVNMMLYCNGFEESLLLKNPRVSLEILFDAILQQQPRNIEKSYKRFSSLKELQEFVKTITEFDMCI